MFSLSMAEIEDSLNKGRSICQIYGEMRKDFDLARMGKKSTTQIDSFFILLGNPDR